MIIRQIKKSVLSLYVKLLIVVNPILVREGYLLFDNLDNSSGEAIDCYTLFKYLVAHGERVKYIVQKESRVHKQAKIDKLEKYLKIVSGSPFSWLCYLSLILISLRFKNIVTSHGRIHFLLARFWKASKHCIYIHAQHGIMWLKKSPFAHNLSQKNYDKLVVSSEKEASFAMENGWERNNLLISGLFRFENLATSYRTMSTKSILFMFTWRSSYDTHERTYTQLDNSVYLSRINSLLNNSYFQQLVETYKITVYFAEHHYLKDFGAGKIDVPQYVQKIDICSLSHYISNSSMLVTDYSSACFDFFYQEKPVVFYHLDFDDTSLNEKDKQEHKSVLSRNDSLFNICDKEEQAVQLIRYYTENDFKLEQNKKKIAKSFFDFPSSACDSFITMINS